MGDGGGGSHYKNNKNNKNNKNVEYILVTIWIGYAYIYINFN